MEKIKKANNARLLINIIIYFSTFFYGCYILYTKGGNIDKIPILYYSPLTFYGFSVWVYAVLFAITAFVSEPLKKKFMKYLNFNKNAMFIILAAILIIIYIITKYFVIFGKFSINDLIENLAYVSSMAVYSVEPFFIALDAGQIIKNKYGDKLFKK